MANGRTAACLAVGSELLGEVRLDSNSLAITRTLARHGFRVVEKRVVGDSEEAVAAAITELLSRVDVLILTGGLGPTADDITREAIARALGRELETDPQVEGLVRAAYTTRGRAVPEASLRMAQVVRGARILANRKGVAPGLLITIRDRLLVALPGVPWEMADMLEREVEPELALRGGGTRRFSRTLLLGGVYESLVEEQVQEAPPASSLGCPEPAPDLGVLPRRAGAAVTVVEHHPLRLGMGGAPGVDQLLSSRQGRATGQ